MKKTVTLFFAVLILSSLSIVNAETIYGDIAKEKYLAGMFEPARSKFFVSLNSMQIPTNKKYAYLRKETAVALKKMISDFRHDHPNIRLWVQSSTRNFEYQRAIWDGKWSGATPVAGRNLKKAIPDERLRALEILKKSSMPGTSRHHWGTDLDFNVLENSYYDSGEGKIIYGWLKANAHKYGFAQPYNAGRSEGYEEERWHWSYLPLSKVFYSDWLSTFGGRRYVSFAEKSFLGAMSAADYAEIYVKNVSEECR